MHGEVRLRHGDGEDTDRPEIDRRDLRVLLLDSVPKEKIRWGAKVESLQKQEDGMMSIRFTNGTTESKFRLVVGADGAWSKVRSLVRYFAAVVSLCAIWVIADGWTGHFRHAKILRQILPHQQHLPSKPILRHRPSHGRNRQLHEHG
jgi:2-polyprenyl-6-methoxyphenol hydroxylase-like FAD-dependent oxidoreductase